MKLGLVGYGFGGRVFHAPYLEAAEGIEIAGVVARSADKIAALARDLPGVPVYASLSDMIKVGGIDAVTITTPPETHKPLVLEAVAARLHVMCDKPFAPTLADAMEMAEAARGAGVLLSVFHNRRWDTDFRTLADLVGQGRLGTVTRVHNRMDFDQPETLEAGPGGGLLRDLGSHIVDQMLVLLGRAVAVDAQVDYVDLPEGRTDAGFAIHIAHESGAHSYVSATKSNFLSAREIGAYGSLGTYVVNGTDVQARRVIEGHKPADDPGGWGIEPEEAWGTLHRHGGADTIPSVQSKIQDLYSEFALAVAEGGEGPVSIQTALHTVEVLDAARLAAQTGQTIRFDN